MLTSGVWAKLFASRKGIAAFVAVVFGLVYVIGLVVAATLGKLTWESAFAKIQIASATSSAALIALILGVAHEDAAAKGAGNDSTASTTTNIINAAAGAKPPDAPEGSNGQ